MSHELDSSEFTSLNLYHLIPSIFNDGHYRVCSRSFDVRTNPHNLHDERLKASIQSLNLSVLPTTTKPDILIHDDRTFCRLFLAHEAPLHCDNYSGAAQFAHSYSGIISRGEKSNESVSEYPNLNQMLKSRGAKLSGLLSLYQQDLVFMVQ